MTKIIKHKFSFSHPPETIWEYLTKSELMELWLMKNNFQPIVGHEFQFRTGPIASLNFDGVVYCKVLEIVPFKKLSYSWQHSSAEEEVTLDSVVEWTLQPTSNGTDLTLVHRGFAKAENLEFYNGLNLGWVEKLNKINNLLNK